MSILQSININKVTVGVQQPRPPIREQNTLYPNAYGRNGSPSCDNSGDGWLGIDRSMTLLLHFCLCPSIRFGSILYRTDGERRTTCHGRIIHSYAHGPLPSPYPLTRCATLKICHFPRTSRRRRVSAVDLSARHFIVPIEHYVKSVAGCNTTKHYRR